MIDLARYRATLASVRADRGLTFGVAGVYPALEVLVRAGRVADHLLAPGFRDEPVRAPVFVVGHPRSGTTFLHRLLALDAASFVPWQAWQLLLPSVTLYRAARRARRSAWGDELAFLAGLGEERLFGPMRGAHPTGLRAPEEDSWLFLHAASSPTLEFLTRDPALTRDLWLPDELPAAENARRLAWYRASVQRHLHAEGRGRTLLSKDPHFAGWMRTLAAAFPDARFVLVSRAPADAIASRLGLLATTWRATEPDLRRDDPRLRAVFEASCALYRHAEACFAELPEPRRARVSYDAFVADPEATVLGLYDHLGVSASPSFRAALTAAAADARRRVPTRTPPLRQFGLSTTDLERALGDIAVAR